ncbi:MAG: hypothetical protein NZM05_03040 [Chloroherpetonaceae bacterium]|nr:hypothetical protein [Chloroherpetonaceae bacterium]
MQVVVHLLSENSLLLLFLVAGIGYLIGKVRIGGFSLGIAAVLFVGLAFGALGPTVELPEFCHLFGLVLFVYTIGLASGPTFLSSLRREGLRENLFAVSVLLSVGALVTALHFLFGFSAGTSAGIFAGSMTNTPALANVIQYLRERIHALPDTAVQIFSEPVIAYSLCYPMGVLGVIGAIYILQRLWRINYAEEAKAFAPQLGGADHLITLTVKVTNPDACVETLGHLRHRYGWTVRFVRWLHQGHLTLAHDGAQLAVGDFVNFIAAPDEAQRIAAFLGEVARRPLEDDRSNLDFRRVFVSNPEVVGKKLSELHLREKFEARVARVRRGDHDFIPDSDTTLWLGDRVRVVAPKDRMEEVSKFFGDSYKALSEVDVISLGVGISIGLLLGLIPIPLPSGATFKLGIAGGPLVAGLILGAKGRTGTIIWNIPYSANLTLRQIGLVMFLAGVGTRAGYEFVAQITAPHSIWIFLSGLLVTTSAAFSALFIGYKLLRIPMGRLIGIVSGIHTQPAALAFANEQTHNDLPNLGYTTVFPLVTIVKIFIAQLLVALL